MNTSPYIEEQRKWNDSSMWVDGGHEWSKVFGNTENLWNTHIFETIKPFRNTRILEIAPGYGRMTQFLSILASELTVVDLNWRCVEMTKQKLGNHVKQYLVNDGKSLKDIGNDTQDLVFSYDSFVHMHRSVIEAYVKEIERVLVAGGCGFIHHSWFAGGSDEIFTNVAGRSNMSPEIFKEIVNNNGMTMLLQTPISFQEVTDYISFFSKII